MNKAFYTGQFMCSHKYVVFIAATERAFYKFCGSLPL
jgi:hypothetical protein